MKDYKVSVLPFLLGSFSYSYFGSGSYEFPIAAAIICGILVITKQMKLI